MFSEPEPAVAVKSKFTFSIQFQAGQYLRANVHVQRKTRGFKNNRHQGHALFMKRKYSFDCS